MPADKPRVSIITRTRDRHVLLQRALESISGQTFGDWELILVNDGGDAAALDAFIEPWSERIGGQVKVIHNATALGMQAASNAALAVARGEFVSVHDDDDAWHPEFLESCVNFLDSHGAASAYQGVVTHTVRVWEDIDSQGKVLEQSREPYLPTHEVNLFRTAYENPFPPIAFVYRRAVHEEIGQFDQGFDVAGDLDFNVRFLLRYEIGVVPRPLAYYHWRRNSADEHLQNSVTAQARIHGRRLNEWLNHYLRSYAQGDPAKAGLALNIGHYAVGLQGRADRALERIEDLKAFLGSVGEGLRAELADLPAQAERQRDLKVHLDSISRLLNENALLRLEDLKEHLGSLNGQVAEALATTQGQAPKLQDLKEHLNALSWMLDEQALPGLSGIKEHLDSLNGQVSAALAAAEGQTPRFDDLKAHLGSLSWMLGDQALPGLAGLKEHLDSLNGQVSAALAAAEGQTPRFDDLKAHLDSLSWMLGDQAVPALAALKEHLDSLSGQSNSLQELAHQQIARSVDLKEHLSSVSGLLERINWQQERTLELAERSEQWMSDLTNQRIAETFRTQLEELRATVAAETDELTADIRQQMTDLRSAVQRVADETVRPDIVELRAELADLRKVVDGRTREFRIGPFVFAYRRKAK